MSIKEVIETVWKYYYEGRAKATAQTFSKKDIGQMVKMSYGEILKQKFELSKKNDEYNEPDFSFVAILLSTQEFSLSDPNTAGMRRADMGNLDLYRLPKDAHITDIYPIGGTCGSDENNKITLVRTGEEYFYTKPKFSFFKFGVVKGNGINFYNLPPCVTKVGVETTINTDSAQVSLDIAYEISVSVLGILFKEKIFPTQVIDNPYDVNVLDIKHRLAEQQQTP